MSPDCLERTLNLAGWITQGLLITAIAIYCLASLWTDLACPSTHCHDPFNPPKGVGDVGEVGPFEGEAP